MTEFKAQSLGGIMVTALLSAPALGQVGVWTSHLSTNGNVSLATDPAIPNLVYTNIGRSLDSGHTWEMFDLTPPAVSVAAGPAGTVYAGTGIYSNGILYKSTDSGGSWQTFPFTDQGELASFAVDPVAPATVYAIGVHAPEGVGSLFHVYWELQRSVDGGQTWASLDTGFPGELGYDPPGDVLGLNRGVVSALAVNPAVSGTVYVSAPLGNFKSTDGGADWIALPPLPGGAGDRLIAWAVDHFNPARMYAISRSSGQLLESTDGGNQFVALPGVPNNTFTAIVLDPVRPHRVYAAVWSLFALAGSVSMSDDSGMTWQTISNGFPQGQQSLQALAIDATGRFLHVSTFTGVYDYEIGAAALSLNALHPFTVTLSATDPHTGQTAPGAATQGNDLWGYFSIPAITNNPNNPEVFVKLLDGTAINGEYWFFYGGLTNLEYTLTVKDDATGQTKAYTKPAGSECGGSDTAAFAP